MLGTKYLHLQYHNVEPASARLQLLAMLIPPQTPQSLPQPPTRAPPRRIARLHLTLPLAVALPITHRHVGAGS